MSGKNYQEYAAIKKQAALGFGLWLVLSAGTAGGEDAARGQTLHDASCVTSCHADRVKGAANGLYTRSKRRVNSLAQLRAQVSFCNQQLLQSEWWPEDEADVVTFLNGTFYKFK